VNCSAWATVHFMLNSRRLDLRGSHRPTPERSYRDAEDYDNQVRLLAACIIFSLLLPGCATTSRLSFERATRYCPTWDQARVVFFDVTQWQIKCQGYWLVVP